MKKIIPGTNMVYTDNNDAFSVFRPLIEITGGLSLGQICSITGLQSSTIQNWVKRGYVQRPVNKKYSERHLARILLISALRDCMNIEQIGELMILINGDTEDDSDDIVSETRLYDIFCKTISNLDTQMFTDLQIEEVIKKQLKNESHQDELMYALKIMVYAYISGICFKQIKVNQNSLKQLKGYKDEE